MLWREGREQQAGSRGSGASLPVAAAHAVHVPCMCSRACAVRVRARHSGHGRYLQTTLRRPAQWDWNSCNRSTALARAHPQLAAMAPELGPLPRYRRPAHYARHVPLAAPPGAPPGAATGSSPPVAHLTGFARPWRFHDVSHLVAYGAMWWHMVAYAPVT